MSQYPILPLKSYKPIYNCQRSGKSITLPDLVNCVAKQPPKKDDGQSSLQVALKTGAFDIADYLIDMECTIFDFYKAGPMARLLTMIN